MEILKNFNHKIKYGNKIYINRVNKDFASDKKIINCKTAI